MAQLEGPLPTSDEKLCFGYAKRKVPFNLMVRVMVIENQLCDHPFHHESLWFGFQNNYQQGLIFEHMRNLHIALYVTGHLFN